jgi:hypothetical protein
MTQQLQSKNRSQDTAHSREGAGREKPLAAKPAKNIRKGREDKATLLATFEALLGELCG